MISGILGQSPECQKIWFLLLFFQIFGEQVDSKILLSRRVPWAFIPNKPSRCDVLVFDSPSGVSTQAPPPNININVGGGPADGEGPGAQPGLRPAAVGGGLPQCQAPPARGPVLAWEGPARPPQPLRGEPRDRPPGPVCRGPFLGGGKVFRPPIIII